ncbi:hypothetical protein ALI144C_43560 [Actinosynnema sp. ALI-1.44]|nr:hypothetical protein ALI144C_43560 [Actinosynnema sp. ALI-1.44]
MPRARRELRVEPMIELEWSQAIEPHTALASIAGATRPAETRRAWIHRAPEDQVLALYTSASKVDRQLAAPWWLKALAAGELSSRAEGFLLEDRVGKLLDARPGWVFVPWYSDGDSGYWEYMPSERRVTGPAVPTTLVFTHRHDGWLDIHPVHLTTAQSPTPLAVKGMGDLRSNLARWETVF